MHLPEYHASIAVFCALTQSSYHSLGMGMVCGMLILDTNIMNYNL